MPISFSPDDAAQGFGIQAGLHRITSAEWMVHQFPPSKDGKQSDPFVTLAITYLPIDEAGKAIGDAQIDYSLRVGPKFGETLDKSKFAPAAVPGKPLPLRVGEKGLYLEAVGDQGQLFSKSKPMLYFEQLTKVGFDKTKLATGNIGVLVGTEGDVFELVSKNEGTDDSGKPMKDTKIPAFKSIRKFGYEAGGAASVAAAASAAAAAAPTNGASASATASGDAHALAISLLGAISEHYKDKDEVTVQEAKKRVLSIATKMKPRPDADVRKAAEELIGTESFYEGDDASAIAIMDGDKLVFQNH